MPWSSDPTANSIKPPVAGGKPAEGTGDISETPPTPPADTEANKVAILDQHRAR